MSQSMNVNDNFAMNVNDNFEVIQARKCGQNYYILCYLPDNKVTPWASWVSPTPDGKIERYRGNYYFSEKEALDQFSNRY